MKHLRNTALIYALLAGSICAQLVMSNGSKTVSSAGTAVTLTASSTPFVSGTIWAKSTNVGLICFGGSSILASSKNGLCLQPGQSYSLLAIPGVAHDLGSIYMDAVNSSDGAGFAYEK